MKIFFKQHFLLLAAVLLISSCVKDEKSDKTEMVFSVKLLSGNTISKIVYTDRQSSVSRQFEDSDVNNVKMNVSGDGVSGSLDLKKEKGNFVFSGILTVDNDKKADFFIGAVTLNGTVEFNSESLVNSSVSGITDLMQNCRHNYTTTFNYKSDKIVLKDDRAYLEFILAEGQKKVCVNGLWYDVNPTSHRAWVAVSGGTTVETRIKGSKTVSAGKIYTIDCSDAVDLGLNVLWKTVNEDGLYSFADATNKFETADQNGFRLPDKDEMTAFHDIKPQGGWTTVNGKKGWLTENEYGSIFLPSEGRDNGNGAGQFAFYWSKAPEDGGGRLTYTIYFDYYNYLDVINHYYSKDSKCSVRLVRDL